MTIEGLKVHFTSDELERHLRKRAQFHRDRADHYAKQVTELRALGEQPQAVTNNPITSLEQSEKSHRGRSEFFTVLADHLVPDETYRLPEHDLTRIELIAGNF